MDNERTLDDQDLQTLQDAREGFQQLTQEIGKVIIGQEAIVRLVVAGVFSRGHTLIIGVPWLGQDATGQDAGSGARLVVSSNSVYARHDAGGHYRHGIAAGRSGHRHATYAICARSDLRACDSGGRDQSNATQDSGSTYSKRCKSTRSRAWASRIDLDEPFHCVSPRRIPSNRREPIRCQKLSWIGSCSVCGWTIRRRKKKKKSR